MWLCVVLGSEEGLCMLCTCSRYVILNLGVNLPVLPILKLNDKSSSWKYTCVIPAGIIQESKFSLSSRDASEARLSQWGGGQDDF